VRGRTVGARLQPAAGSQQAGSNRRSLAWQGLPVTAHPCLPNVVQLPQEAVNRAAHGGVQAVAAVCARATGVLGVA
jgi:hypothetical protein